MKPDELTDRLLDLTLPHAVWKHRGHIVAGFTLVSRLGEADALECLRAAIPAYNESVGTPNTDSEGYHDTITIYFVWALARLVERGATLEEALADPLVALEAPLRFWPKDVLSPEARAAWMEPALGDGAPTGLPRLPAGCPPAPVARAS